jgi:hypothetical protein
MKPPGIKVFPVYDPYTHDELGEVWYDASQENDKWIAVFDGQQIGSFKTRDEAETSLSVD